MLLTDHRREERITRNARPAVALAAGSKTPPSTARHDIVQHIHSNETDRLLVPTHFCKTVMRQQWRRLFDRNTMEVLTWSGQQISLHSLASGASYL